MREEIGEIPREKGTDLGRDNHSMFYDFQAIYAKRLFPA